MPPLLRKDEREAIRPWMIVAWLLLVVGLCLLAAGCATAPLPKCPDAQYVEVDMNGEKWVVFEHAQWQRAMATYIGLSNRTCEITKPAMQPAAPVKPVKGTEV